MMLTKLVHQQCDSILESHHVLQNLHIHIPKGLWVMILFCSFLLCSHNMLNYVGRILNYKKQRILSFEYFCDLDSGYLLKWKGYLKRLR